MCFRTHGGRITRQGGLQGKGIQKEKMKQRPKEGGEAFQRVGSKDFSLWEVQGRTYTQQSCCVALKNSLLNLSVKNDCNSFLGSSCFHFGIGGRGISQNGRRTNPPNCISSRVLSVKCRNGKSLPTDIYQLKKQ